LQDLTPSADILRLYRDLGGRILTIGSDSHRKENLGAYIQSTVEEARKLGFEEIYTFDHMRPIPHKL
jgi:histidinol-phosphatase (PHP family)